MINFDQSSWFPAPDYVVMKLYRDHFAPELLEIAGNAGDLNATATRTPDGERIYVKLVNPREQEVSVEVALRGDFPLLAAGMQVVAPGSLSARNTMEQPAAVQAVPAKIERTRDEGTRTAAGLERGRDHALAVNRHAGSRPTGVSAADQGVRPTNGY